MSVCWQLTTCRPIRSDSANAACWPQRQAVPRASWQRWPLFRRVDAVQPDPGAVDLDGVAVDDRGHALQIGPDRFAVTGGQRAGEDKGQGGKGGMHHVVSGASPLPNRWAGRGKAPTGP